MTTDGEDKVPTTPSGEPEAVANAQTAAPEANPTAAETASSDAHASSNESPTSSPSPIDELRERVTDAATGFLKSRFGLEEGADGSLHLPDRGVFENVGQRADQFFRGFLRGVVERTPEEREVDAGLRDKDDVPSATEVVGRLLSKASGAVSTSFHQYLKDHVAPKDQAEPVLVDGRFLMQHGAPLLATFVQALGSQFASQAGASDDVPPAAPEPEPDPATSDSPKPHVDYRVDLPSLFTSLFVRPKDDDGSGGHS